MIFFLPDYLNVQPFLLVLSSRIHILVRDFVSDRYLVVKYPVRSALFEDLLQIEYILYVRRIDLHLDHVLVNFLIHRFVRII
jgi:hypothetical protein